MRRPAGYAAALLATLTLGCAGREVAPGSPPESTGHVTAADGTRLFYRRVGNGGPVVIVPADVFLHPGLDALARGRTLVYYDPRNRGRSDSVSIDREVSIQADVADLEAVRAQLGIERFDLVGWSYLGLVSALYALEHPDRVRRMVQIGAVPMRVDARYPDGLGPESYDAALDTARVSALRALRASGHHVVHPEAYCREEWAVTRATLVGDPAHVERLAMSPCDCPNEWPGHFGRHLARHFPSVEALPDPRARVAALATPTLVVHGTRDRNAAYGAGREWAMTLPEARLLTVEGAAHCPWADAPEVLDAIAAFLDGAWPAGVERVAALERPASGAPAR